MPDYRRFLTIEECAQEARVSVSTVRYWVQLGKLASLRPGRRRLIERIEFERFLNAGKSVRRQGGNV